jgi:hypothetical protein
MPGGLRVPADVMSLVARVAALGYDIKTADGLPWHSRRIQPFEKEAR